MAEFILKQAVAVIDKRTTLICLDVAGQIRAIREPFVTIAGDFDSSPFHVHCRTIIAPYMAGFVNSQRAEANAELQRRPLKQRDKRKYGNRVPGPDRRPEIQVDDSVVPVRITGALYGRRWTAWARGARADTDVTGWDRNTGWQHLGRSMNALLRGTAAPRDAVAARGPVLAFDRFFRRNKVSVDDAFLLHRGVAPSPTFDPGAVLVQGQTFLDAGWFGGSLRPEVAEAFAGSGGWMLQVTVPAGRSFVYGMKAQAEKVLPRGSRFLVTRVDRATRTAYLTLE